MKTQLYSQAVNDLKEGKLTLELYAAYVLILNEVDSSLVWIGSALELRTLLTGKISEDKAQHLLASLYKRGYLRASKRRGYAGNFPIKVVAEAVKNVQSAPVKQGELKAEIPAQIPAEISDKTFALPAVSYTLPKLSPEQSAEFVKLTNIYGQSSLLDAIEAFASNEGTDIDIFFKEVKFWVKTAGAGLTNE